MFASFGTGQHLQRVATMLLRPDTYRLAVVGPFKSARRFKKLLAARA